MNNYLKIIALLLAMLQPIAVAAYDYEVDGIYYNINNALGTASVTYKTISYNSYSGNVTIPESITYNGGIFHVTHITGHAFQQCRNLTSITIPNSVTTKA